MVVRKGGEEPQRQAGKVAADNSLFRLREALQTLASAEDDRARALGTLAAAEKQHKRAERVLAKAEEGRDQAALALAAAKKDRMRAVRVLAEEADQVYARVGSLDAMENSAVARAEGELADADARIASAEDDLVHADAQYRDAMGELVRTDAQRARAEEELTHADARRAQAEKRLRLTEQQYNLTEQQYKRVMAEAGVARAAATTTAIESHIAGSFSSQRLNQAEVSGPPEMASGPPELPFGPPADLPGYVLKPDPLSARTPAEFVELLKQYRIWAGEPSYREIVRRARNAFGASTLCEALKSSHLPPEKLVRAFVWACSGSEEDLQAWTTAWRRLRMKHQRPQNETMAAVTALPIDQEAPGVAG
ncbi:hypothetical protein [Nonomuraea jabiensis]|uniref:Uncharacterized protein YbaA (DUF1428 family) n=1 Tax=Nonomuraea jabiensis TaxID=882448 RepID=A0A7W9LEE2_9ACTN|nr:hypothetical protein [Nonomuraea jabiensis]MBB5780746.1 uncharacterized protein YbaA (DUF1428 family) [Nonomuraea jabiensis]